MKLLSKFTLWYLVITAVVLATGGLIVFYAVQHEIDEEAKRRLHSMLDHTADALRKGESPGTLMHDQLEITEIDINEPVQALSVHDTMAVFQPRQAIDRKLTLTASYQINDRHYLISVYDFVAEPDEIAEGVMKSLAWTFAILLVLVGITSIFISQQILAPFHKSLAAIENFSLRQTKSIQLPDTQTSEFKKLNQFVKTMTAKAQDDYKSLKEFTENAAHELQTPLAVIRGKLELLLESDIDEKQARLIADAHQSAERLTRINQSLTLLNKLENQEFETVQFINLSKQLNHNISILAELMDMKSITLQTDIQEHVSIRLNAALADMLLTNLLSNAIRHNNDQALITIRLTSSALTIANSGNPPNAPTSEMFQRFRKGNESQDSVGLGLSIVKQICDISDLRVEYNFKAPFHIIEISW
jgi:signal transduction histidine kinase